VLVDKFSGATRNAEDLLEDDKELCKAMGLDYSKVRAKGGNFAYNVPGGYDIQGANTFNACASLAYALMHHDYKKLGAVRFDDIYNNANNDAIFHPKLVRKLLENIHAFEGGQLKTFETWVKEYGNAFRANRPFMHYVQILIERFQSNPAVLTGEDRTEELKRMGIGVIDRKFLGGEIGKQSNSGIIQVMPRLLPPMMRGGAYEPINIASISNKYGENLKHLLKKASEGGFEVEDEYYKHVDEIVTAQSSLENNLRDTIKLMQLYVNLGRIVGGKVSSQKGFPIVKFMQQKNIRPEITRRIENELNNGIMKCSGNIEKIEGKMSKCEEAVNKMTKTINDLLS
jgi:hypothetical protein